MPKNSMEKERKAKKKWISELMEEKETREAIDFLHKLDGKDFLFYVQLISDLHRLARKSSNLRYFPSTKLRLMLQAQVGEGWELRY